jgi:aminoacrylate hydrolase
MALALAAPERLGRLVVVNGWARLDPYTERCFEVRLALLRDSGPEAYLRAQPIFLYPPDWISTHSDRLDAEAAGHLADFPGRAAVEARIGALRGFDIGAGLGRIAAPVLVLASADDALVPASAGRRLAEGLAYSTWMLQSRGGHACNVTEPDRFHRCVLPWLAGETLIEE